MIRYCLACKVQKECDDYATRQGINVGVWGGKRRMRDLETGV